MAFSAPPSFAAWQHRDARAGFEVVFFRESDGIRVEGETTAVEAGEAWVVSYAIDLDLRWRTRRGVVTSRTKSGERRVLIEADGEGRWQIDGSPAPHLDGCLDLDLESSAFTNAFPVHRLDLVVGARAEAPAAYVRAIGLDVERLEQRYVRVDDERGRACYDYDAPIFGFSCRLVYDASGLVLDYPGIAVRTA